MKKGVRLIELMAQRLERAMSHEHRLVKPALAVLVLGAFLGLGPFEGDAQQLRYMGARGCGAIVLFGWTQDQTEVVVVNADRVQLGLHSGDNTVTVTPDRKGLEVRLELYGRPQRDLPEYHCNDIRLQEWDRPASTLSAVSGTLLITLGEPGTVNAQKITPSAYEATVVLRDVAFRRTDGTLVSVPAPITLKALVGFIFG